MMNAAYVSRRRCLWTILSGTATAISLRGDEPKVAVPEYNRISDEDEVKFGREAAAALEKEKQLSVVDEPAVQDYVSGILLKVARSSRRPNLPYNIKVVNTKVVNALSLPGGFVYLNRGLIEFCQTEAELVSALSHEVGHVVGRHGANAVARATSAQSLITEASRILLGSEAPAQLLLEIGGPIGMLALLKYTRTQELEADMFGFYNMQRAGWHPQGMIDLFKRLGEQDDSNDSLFSILESHPAPADREAQVTAEMRSFPPRPGLAMQSDAFHAVKEKLKLLPAPRVTNQPVP